MKTLTSNPKELRVLLLLLFNGITLIITAMKNLVLFAKVIIIPIPREVGDIIEGTVQRLRIQTKIIVEIETHHGITTPLGLKKLHTRIVHHLVLTEETVTLEDIVKQISSPISASYSKTYYYIFSNI